MNEQVLLCAIQDLKKVLNKIENTDNYIEEDCIRLEKEVNSFLANLSAYRLHNKLNNKLLSGLQFAYNLTKHEETIISVKDIEDGGFTFPIEIPFEIPCNQVFWIDISDLDIKVEYENQYKNYLKKLSNKRIINTVEKVEKLIPSKVKSHETKKD